MKAIAYSNPGPPEVLQLLEVARPVPRDHEVLIRIRATTVSAGDCEARRSLAPGAFRPLRPRQAGIVILGQELAGEVEAVGRRVARFRKGDQIVAWSGLRLPALLRRSSKAPQKCQSRLFIQSTDHFPQSPCRSTNALLLP